MYLDTPVIISRNKIEEIVSKEIIESQEPGATSSLSWFFTISPTGEIIKPEKEYDFDNMARYQIYPKDNILKMLAKHFYGEEFKDDYAFFVDNHDFMLFNGYINIEGTYSNNSNENIRVEYNSNTSNDYYISKNIVHRNLEQNGIQVRDTLKEPQNEELSNKIPFFRKKINSLLEQFGLSENQINELLNRLGKTEKQFLAELEEKYKKHKSKIQEGHEGYDFI